MNSLCLTQLARSAGGGIAIQVAALLAPQVLMLDAAYGQQAIVPNCSPYLETYRISDDGKTCIPKAPADDFKTVKAFCDAAHGVFSQAGGGKPEACALPTVVPTCPGGSAITYAAETKQCVLSVTAPVSDPTNYRGDCLRVVTRINGAPDGKRLYVVSQSGDGKVLNVVKGKEEGCGPGEGSETTPPAAVNLSDVLASGARRSGYVYGMLVAPFKYYPHSGQILGASTIGPYIGWRADGLSNSTRTYVLSAGISSVPGTAKATAGDDPQVAKGPVPMTAWSLTGGAIFEVSKGKSPFRIGALVGVDFAGKKAGVSYENNGRPWLALQLGFDFTDL